MPLPSLAQIGALKFGSFKVGVLELGVHEIHICQLALPTLLGLQQLDKGLIASWCSGGRCRGTDQNERQPQPER